MPNLDEAAVAALGNTPEENSTLDNGMLGKYVIVRCRDAGVHSGYLIAYNKREAVLKCSRRLWYWHCAEGQKFLSGVATAGITENSNIGVVVDRIHLTETCEIILCTQKAQKTIEQLPASEQ